MDAKKPELPPVKPAPCKSYRCQQSKYDVPKLSNRLLLSGFSGSGKSSLAQYLVLTAYRGCFARCFLLSSTAFSDVATWGPVRKYIYQSKDQGGMGVPEGEEVFYDTWDGGAHLTRILDEAKAVTDWVKGKPNRSELFSVLVIVDDWASNAQAMKGSGSEALQRAYLAGRHANVSIWCLTQRFRNIHQAVRSGSIPFFFRPLSSVEEDAICEEYGAAHPGGKAGLRKTLREVTGKQHGFLQIDVSRSPPRFLDGFKPLPLPPPS